MIVGMMSFYDEPEIYLKRSVRGLARLGARYIVACDGAYAMFSGGEARSSSDQIEALRLAALNRGIAPILHQPESVWAGNEVEKRQKMLDLALSIACDDDWLAIWDCDYRLLEAPHLLDVGDALRSTTRDVATISFTEDLSADDDRDFYPMGMFLRARQGTRMDGNHHTYLLPDGRRTQVLRRPVPNEADAIHLGDVRVLHDVHQRDSERRARQVEYYERRDDAGIES